ncbi:MAG TPA: hypothetical protein VN345_06115, partial [Blastocatellia bacterium]|nr:hypothetical protein [Blastocatellia bacterium]
MKRYALSTLVFLLLAPAALYAQKRAFTVEDLYRIKSISDVHVSPDGKSLIYSLGVSDLPRAKQVSHIWLMDIDGSNPRQMTQGEKSENSPSFSPDGKWILFISDRDGSGNLYVMPVAGGEA